MEYTIPKIAEARKKKPTAIIVAGGSGPALRYQFYLDNAEIDMVILAEGEYPLLDLCEEKNWRDIEGVVFKNKAKVLSAEDYWDISKGIDFESMAIDRCWKKTAALYDDPDYNEINTVRLFTSNYCPMGCKFCTLTLWKKNASGRTIPVVGLSVEQIVDMIKQVVKCYKDVRQIFFVDDDFFLLRARGIDFCNRVIEEKSKGGLPEQLKFISMSNINRLDEENIKLIAAAGFRVLSVGVESTSQYVLDSYNKKQSPKQIWKITELLLKYGIKPYYTAIMFSPEGRINDLIMDLEGFRKLAKMGVGLSVEPYLIPLPGTPFWEEQIPQSSRWVSIGQGGRIKKGFAWLPIDEEARVVFDMFEEWYPKYRKKRFDVDGVGHKEKNYQAGIILDAVEIVLRYIGYNDFSGRFGHSEAKRIYMQVDKIEKVDVDIVGDFVM